MEFYSRTSKDIKPVKKPVFWSEKCKDFDKKQNLVLGRAPYIDIGNEDDITAGQVNTPIEKGTLTDGVYPTVINYDENYWFKFMRSVSRDIIFDLEKTSTLSGCSIVMLYDKSGAVYFPLNLTVSLSDDGKTFEKVHSCRQLNPKKEAEIRRVNIDFKENIQARFIKISFGIECWVFFGEIEVFGTKKILENSRPLRNCVLPKKKKVHNFNRYLMPEDFMGIHDLLLAYNCHPTHRTQGKLSVEEFMPYVGYYGRDGKLKDYFFDAYLFLPFAAFPIRGEHPQADLWHTYIDNTFAKGWNTDALDFAFGQTKKMLGDEDSDRKAKVFLSILYPFEKYGKFGDLCSDGDILDFTNLNDRKKAVKWEIDENVRRFSERNYAYSELSGFYWFEEWIYADMKEERDLIKFACDYVHSLGLKVIWIPYYCSEGYNRWQELGIDYASMQPNYSFRDQAPAEIIDSCANVCKRENMCVEMEIGGRNDMYIDKYNEYMKRGAKLGYMEAVHMYYQGGGPGEFYEAYKSDDEKINNVYHDTYLFSKHKYKAD